MKIIEISLAKALVIDDVSLNCAYTGVKDDSTPASFDRVATVEEDRDILLKFFEEMCGEITNALKEFIVSSSSSGEAFSISLQISNAFDDSLAPSVNSDIFTAMVAGVTARWFRYAYPSRAAEWDQNASMLLSRAHSKLCLRKKPRRESPKTITI